MLYEVFASVQKIPRSRRKRGKRILQQFDVGAVLDILHGIAGIEDLLRKLLNLVIVEAGMCGADNDDVRVANHVIR